MSDSSTVHGLEQGRREPRPVWHRRIGVGLLSLVVLAGATGWLGVRSDATTAEAAGYRLAVTYARTARSGLDVPLRIELTAPGPLADGPLAEGVTLSISREYLNIFEQQGFHPEPASTTGDAQNVHLTFDPPPSGNVLVVDFDAYIQPSSQQGADAVIALVVDGAVVVSVDISTFLWP